MSNSELFTANYKLCKADLSGHSQRMSQETLLLQFQIQQIWLGEVGSCNSSQRSISKSLSRVFHDQTAHGKSAWKACFSFLSSLKPEAHPLFSWLLLHPPCRETLQKQAKQHNLVGRTPTLESEFWLNFLMFDLGKSLSTSLNPNFFISQVAINNINLMR